MQKKGAIEKFLNECGGGVKKPAACARLANAPVSGGTPSAQVDGSARGCHNCGHGHLGGWKTYRHWPCLTCRVGADIVCGDDNWKPNAAHDGRRKETP